MNELNPALTRCFDCDYRAIIWHEDIHSLESCSKCNGQLELICVECGHGERDHTKEFGCVFQVPQFFFFMKRCGCKKFKYCKLTKDKE